MTAPSSRLPPAVARRLARVLRAKAANPKAPDEYRRRWIETAGKYEELAEGKQDMVNRYCSNMEK